MVRCDAVWCGAGFCGPWCWVWQVKYSSFGWLCLLISENLSDHAYVFLVVELIFIYFCKRLCQQVLLLSEYVIVFFPSSLTRRLIACRHSILVCIDYDGKDFR